MNRLLFAPLLVLLLSSCKKPESGGYPTGELRLQRIKGESGRISSEFEYTPDGKVLSQKHYWMGRSTPDEINYAYDRQGRLERVEAATRGHLSCFTCDGPALKSTQTFEYNTAGQLTKTLHWQEDGTLTSQWTHDYDGSGRLVRRNSTTSTGAKGNFTTYGYDSRGNILRVETFDASGRLTNRDTYEYDDRPNPFRPLYLGMFAALFRSPNNVVRSKAEFLSPGGGPPAEGSSRYTYDPVTGYPVRAEHESGSVSIFEYN